MSAPFKRFVVHTQEKGPNQFLVYVSDLPELLKLAEGLTEASTDLENYKFCLRRALFIEKAIQKAIDEDSQ